MGQKDISVIWPGWIGLGLFFILVFCLHSLFLFHPLHIHIHTYYPPFFFLLYIHFFSLSSSFILYF